MEKCFKNLDISSAQGFTLNTNFEKVNRWWFQQNDEAVAQIHKVAVIIGSPAAMINANVNMDSLRKVFTAAITMSC